ncbi:MAG: hypothetical protein LBG96_06755 [Tannerella sp.]|nr:hypothetical protein [Tannerella sp.]
MNQKSETANKTIQECINESEVAGSDETGCRVNGKTRRTDADIIVDNEKQVLHVNIHRTDHWADDKIPVNLCEQLNQTQTISLL